MKTFTNLRSSIQSAIHELDVLLDKLDVELKTVKITVELEDAYDYYNAARSVLKRRCSKVDWTLIPEEMDYGNKPKQLRGMLALLRSDAELQIYKETSRLQSLPVIGAGTQSFPFTHLHRWALSVTGYDVAKVREPISYLITARDYLDSVMETWQPEPKRSDPFRYAKDYLTQVSKAGRELLNRVKPFRIDNGLLISFEGYLTTIRRMTG